MDELLTAFLEDFPDDEVATLLATLRDSGGIIRDRELADGRISYEMTLNGHTFAGRGADDISAARALVLAASSHR